MLKPKKKIKCGGSMNKVYSNSKNTEIVVKDKNKLPEKNL